MPNVNGMQLLHKAKISAPETPFVIFSAYGNVEKAVEAMREGAFDFIEKPFKAARFKVVIEKCLQHRSLYKEKRALENQLKKRYSFDNIIGRSQGMQSVFDMIERVAKGIGKPTKILADWAFASFNTLNLARRIIPALKKINPTTFPI